MKYVDRFIYNFQRDVSPLHLVLGFLIGAAIAAGIIGATACKPSQVGPVVDAAACIAKEAVGGASLPAIAEACGVAVEEAVASLLASRSPEVQMSRAAAEARRARLAFTQSTLCEGTVIPFDAGAIWEGGGK